VRVASIARHTFLKLVPWQVIDELSENSLADIHPSLVGNRTADVGAHGIPPENFQIKKSSFPPNQLNSGRLLVG